VINDLLGRVGTINQAFVAIDDNTLDHRGTKGTKGTRRFKGKYQPYFCYAFFVPFVLFAPFCVLVLSLAILIN
jgi:hypothetical protein